MKFQPPGCVGMNSETPAYYEGETLVENMVKALDQMPLSAIDRTACALGIRTAYWIGVAQGRSERAA